MSVQDRVSAIIGKVGQSITVRRPGSTSGDAWNPTVGSPTDYTVTAAVRGYSAKEIAGIVQQGDREVRIAAADLSITPKANSDLILIGTHQYGIVAVNTRGFSGTDAIHILTVRG